MRLLGTYPQPVFYSQRAESWSSELGDTIVEVLISLAIISLVLVAAYASVRHNTAETQSTQEHMTALQLAQGQVEFLRAAGTMPSGKTCFDQSGTATNGANCDVTLSGGAQYRLSITPNLASGIYTVQAVWTTQSAQTSDNTNVTLYYKLVQ